MYVNPVLFGVFNNIVCVRNGVYWNIDLFRHKKIAGGASRERT